MLVEAQGLADTPAEIIGRAIAVEGMSIMAPGARPYQVDFDRLIRLLDGG